MNERHADVVIVGAGIIGIACAYYLLAAGRSVIVLEQASVGAGSSHGNCGTLTPSHASPLPAPGMIGVALRQLLRTDAPLRITPRLDPELLRWLMGFASHCNAHDFLQATRAKAPLLLRSRALIEELVRSEKLACEFEPIGAMNIFRNARHFDAACASIDLMVENGLEVEVLDTATALQREPALKPGFAGALFHPGDAQLRPDRYIAELARVVRERGGVIHESTHVVGFKRSGDRIDRVHTSNGDFNGRDVVFAPGAWSPEIGRQLDLRIPIQPGKGYSITYTRPTICPRVALTLKEPGVCVTAWGSGYRLGSTMEFSGYDSSLNQTRLAAIRRGAADFLHEPEGPQMIEEWYGWRPMTPDDLPILGRAPHIENLIVATGHGMLGVTLSAVTGLLTSELISATPSMDLSPFALERFSRRR